MKLAGQRKSETQGALAGEPGGHVELEIHHPSAARRKPKIAGHLTRETQLLTARNGAARGQQKYETQGACAAGRATIDLLIEVGRRDDFAIRQRMRIRQATLSHIARSEFSYHTHLPDAERKKAMDAATKLVKAIRAGQEHALSMLVRATDLAAAPWEEIQTGTEKEMVKLARHLPAYEWVQGVRGFGDLSFARIIAETGDLSSYANPAKVWKRLGLAVFDGERNGAPAMPRRRSSKVTHRGADPRRGFSFHSVYLAQSARKESGGQDVSDAQNECAAGGDGAGQQRDETHAQSAGPYRLLYDTKKAEYLERVTAGEAGWTKLRADRAAKRYAEKRLLRDLWIAWTRDAGHVMRETQGVTAGAGGRGGQARLEARKTTATPVATE